MSSQSSPNIPGRDNTNSPIPKPPSRLNAPIPGPAPYSVPPSYSSNNGASASAAPSSSPQIMGPPPVRLQTGLYPSTQGQNGNTFRPIISPAGYQSAPPAPPPEQQQEDRVQDAEQLQDALASAGVDLKAEEFNLSQITTPTSTTTSHPPPVILPPSYGGALTLQQQLDEGKLIFNRSTLSRFVDRIVAKQYNIPRIDNEVIILLSLTLEHRLRQLISQMCLLARHRTSPLPPPAHPHPHPSQSQSTFPTLLSLARQERQKEESFQQSRKRSRQSDATKDPLAPPDKRPVPSPATSKSASGSNLGATAGTQAGARVRGAARGSGGAGAGAGGISAEMTSEAQKRSTDTTVNVMLGGGRKKRYSWMDVASTSGGGVSGSTAGGGGGAGGVGGGGGGSMPSSPGGIGSPIGGGVSGNVIREDEKLRGRTVERVGWVTLKDALEAMENEGGGEGGLGLGWDAGGKALWKGWARIKD